MGKGKKICEKKSKKECPNCAELWSKMEIENQKCLNCNFPNVHGGFETNLNYDTLDTLNYDDAI